MSHLPNTKQTQAIPTSSSKEYKTLSLLLSLVIDLKIVQSALLLFLQRIILRNRSIQELELRTGNLSYKGDRFQLSGFRKSELLGTAFCGGCRCNTVTPSFADCPFNEYAIAQQFPNILLNSTHVLIRKQNNSNLFLNDRKSSCTQFPQV